jgi:hypothetical protein
MTLWKRQNYREENIPGATAQARKLAAEGQKGTFWSNESVFLL